MRTFDFQVDSDAETKSDVEYFQAVDSDAETSEVECQQVKNKTAAPSLTDDVIMNSKVGLYSCRACGWSAGAGGQQSRIRTPTPDTCTDTQVYKRLLEANRELEANYNKLLESASSSASAWAIHTE